MNQASEKIVVSGGTGFLGSHTVVVLQEQGFEFVVVDSCPGPASMPNPILPKRSSDGNPAIHSII